MPSIFGDREELVALFTDVPKRLLCGQVVVLGIFGDREELVKKLLCGQVAVLVFCDDTPNPPVVASAALPKSLNGLRAADPELELGLLEGDEVLKRLLPEADSWPPKPADALLEVPEACFMEPSNVAAGVPLKIPL